MTYDFIIVGAGASGLLAAIVAARAKQKVLVIEKNPIAGKKILATGNGRCNYTNLVQEPECYRSDDSAFVDEVLSHFDVKKTINFFKEIGIYPKEINGYLYPNSEQASSFVDLLIMECQRLGVEFIFQEKVIEVKKPYFTIKTKHTPLSEKKAKRNIRKQKNIVSHSIYNDNNLKDRQEFNSYYAKKLILATGGCAQPMLGSDGSGYTLAKSLGHTIVEPLPALVQLKSPDKICQTLSGVRTSAKVNLLREDKIITSEEGEINFTDYGISGIPIMQISRFVSKALVHTEDIELNIDLLPTISSKDLMELIRKRIHHNGEKNMQEVLLGLLNDKLSYGLVRRSSIDGYRKSKDVGPDELEKIVGEIKDFKLTINGTNSFDRAQVTTGGIPSKEINPANMESRIINNLFLVGELVNVDGTCGGYNLQWAWSSAYVAGSNPI